MFRQITYPWDYQLFDVAWDKNCHGGLIVQNFDSYSILIAINVCQGLLFFHLIRKNSDLETMIKQDSYDKEKYICMPYYFWPYVGYVTSRGIYKFKVTNEALIFQNFIKIGPCRIYDAIIFYLLARTEDDIKFVSEVLHITKFNKEQFDQILSFRNMYKGNIIDLLSFEQINKQIYRQFLRLKRWFRRYCNEIWVINSLLKYGDLKYVEEFGGMDFRSYVNRINVLLRLKRQGY